MFDEYGKPLLPLGAFEPEPGGRMRLHGGKGAPAPDPRLVEAQVKSLGVQDDMMTRIVEQSDAMLPLQQEQLRFGLDSSRTAFEQSQDDRDYSLTRRDMLTVLQDTMVDDAESFNQAARRSELRNEGYADVNSAFSNAQGQAMRMSNRMGFNPNSGRSSAMTNSVSLAQASALAGASQKVNAAARAEGYALTDRAANALAGYPAMGMQTTQAAAGFGASGLALANQGLAGMTSGYQTAGNMAGNVGSNASSMWSAQSNAQQQANATEGQTTGALAGVAVTAAIAI